MTPTDEPPRWLDQPRNVDRIVYALYAACALAFLADLVYEKHPHFEFEHLFGFHAGYGFVACVVLVVLAKLLRLVLIRDERYYEPPQASPDDAPATPPSHHHEH